MMQFFICTPSLKCGAVSFLIVLVISSIFTLVLFKYSNEILEQEFCFENETIVHVKKVTAPSFVYLKYKNYYQNYKTYAKSISLIQLEGKNDPSLSVDCHPVLKLSDLDYMLPIFNYKNTTVLGKTEKAVPCGLIPASYISTQVNLTSFNGSSIKIDSSNINWNTYQSEKYKNSDENQYIDVEDKHFMVWTRAATTKDFIKLYGKINEDIFGLYQISIHTGTDFLGASPDPCVIFSNANLLGGKNFLLAWTMLTCAICSLIWIIVFIYLNKYNLPITLESAFNVNFEDNL